MLFRHLLPMRNTCLLARKYFNLRFAGRLFQSKSSEIPEQLKKDEPIKYSTSKASKWKARYSNSGEFYDEIPKSQDTIIVFSLTALLVHFLYLREENDLDDKLRFYEANVPLVLKEAQLRQEIESGKRRKVDVRDLEKSLKEVLKLKEEQLTKFGSV